VAIRIGSVELYPADQPEHSRGGVNAALEFLKRVALDFEAAKRRPENFFESRSGHCVDRTKSLMKDRDGRWAGQT
jgi:hypothetical protein